MSDWPRAYLSARVPSRGMQFLPRTRDIAREHGVRWVWNLDDGRFDAGLEDPENAVEILVEFCHEGPAAADVADVELSYEDPRGKSGFKVHR